MQSLAAAPIDAIVTRFSVSEILHHQEHQQRSMWSYSLEKLREVGPRGVFAGYPISFVKESLGFAFFFSTFEAIKGPWYRSYMWLRGHAEGEGSRAVYPSFILAAGALAAVSVQVVHYPVGKIQKLFLMRLESLNAIAKSTRAAAAPSMLPRRDRPAHPPWHLQTHVQTGRQNRSQTPKGARLTLTDQAQRRCPHVDAVAL